MISSLNNGPHATRAWVANRTVFAELDDGRVFGLPARAVDHLADLTDAQLSCVEIMSHPNGDALRWRFGTGDFDVTSIALWDLIEGAPRAVRAWIEGRTVLFELTDGRVFGFPAAGFPRLAKASDEDLATVEVQADGYGLRWEPVDEDISVPGIVAGNVSWPR